MEIKRRKCSESERVRAAPKNHPSGGSDPKIVEIKSGDRALLALSQDGVGVRGCPVAAAISSIIPPTAAQGQLSHAANRKRSDDVADINKPSPTPDETDIELQLFCSQDPKTKTQNTFPTYEQNRIFSNNENKNYLENSEQLKSNQAITNNIGSLPNVSYNLGNACLFPRCQPTKKSQVVANPLVVPIEQNIINNKSLKNFNNRLENVFKGFEDTNSLPHCQSSTSGQNSIQQYVQVPSAYYLSGKPFVDHNDRLHNGSNELGNTNSLPYYETSRGSQSFTHQYNEPARQHFTNRTNQLENIFSDIRSTNSLPPYQAFTSSQGAVNQNGPLGNISINIGNNISLSSCQQSTKKQVFANQYIYEADYVKENYTLPNNQHIIDTKRNVNHKSSLNYTSCNNSSINSLPKTIAHQYVYGPSKMGNSQATSTNQGFRNSLESMNQCGQAIDVSKTIGNISFQPTTNMNRHLKKTMTNPSININNIKSINVHVHQNSNASSSPWTDIQESYSPLMDQRVPLTSQNNTLENNYHELLSKELKNIYSENLDRSKFFEELNSVPVNLIPNETKYASQYNGTTKNAIKDDIYLPTSEEISQSLDDWLNTFQVTPLEPYPAPSQESYLVPESNQPIKMDVSNITTRKKRERHSRSKISQDSLKILKSSFQKDPYPSQSEQHKIADQTGNSVNTIKVWFQNYRQALKKRRMESSYKENTTPNHLPTITQDQNEQQLSTQSKYSASGYSAVYPHQTPSKTLNINDGEKNYVVKVDLPLGTY